MLFRSGTGDLAPYGGDTLGGTISTLTSATNPVGVTLATPTLFVTFATPSAGVTDIQFFMQTVFAGVGGTASCGAVPAPGQLCTPVGSSVTFLNGAGGDSSLTITAQGFARHVSDGPGFLAASPLQMVFTAQFNKPFQSVLADFNTNGSLTSSYSANFAATLTSPTTIGLYRPSTNTFFLGNSNTYGPPDLIVAGWGAPGDLPVVGDWDGNGTTTIGLYRPSTNTFYLRNSNTYGAADMTIVGWGAPGDIPVVGDW